MPPKPRIGVLTAFRASQTSLKVMGLMAGPDKPPGLFPKGDFPVRKSMAIAGEVFATVRASAPASSAARAISPMSVTRGDSFTQRGLLWAAFRAAPTTSATKEWELTYCIHH